VTESQHHYSEVADGQLDKMAASDTALYNDVLTICELILDNPARAQSMSIALTTTDGIVLRVAVPDHHPYKVFWTTHGPRIEAVFPYP
jgi:hypothetical protein